MIGPSSVNSKPKRVHTHLQKKKECMYTMRTEGLELRAIACSDEVRADVSVWNGE